MLRHLLAPLLAVLVVIALPALVAAQNGGSATPTKQGHLHADSRAACPRYRMGPIGLHQRATLYTKTQSAALEGIGVLTITSQARGGGIVAEISDEPSRNLKVAILASRDREGPTSLQLRIRVTDWLIVSNLTDGPVRVLLVIPPSCS